MKQFFAVLCATLMISVVAAWAATKATPDQAKANAEAAAEFMKANGLDAANKEYEKPGGKFTKGDLYIFVMDYKGVMLAHGANPKLDGKNLITMKDTDGKELFVEMIDVAKNKGTGWVEYKWTNPESKKVEPKASYIIRVNDVFLGCGAYK